MKKYNTVRRAEKFDEEKLTNEMHSQNLDKQNFDKSLVGSKSIKRKGLVSRKTMMNH